MKPLKQKISITIDETTLAQIRQLAEQDDRSLSQFINIVLKKYIESLKSNDK